jgi:hypothetical protein
MNSVFALNFITCCLAVSGIVGAYFVGRNTGFKEGFEKCESMDGNSGWLEEAKWWRRNVVQLVAPELRVHDELLDGMPDIALDTSFNEEDYLNDLPLIFDEVKKEGK